MIDRNEKTVIPFAPGSKGNVRVDGVPGDESGKAIIALLKDAADIARATCTQAINAAQKASSQLRAAEDRIKELESEVTDRKSTRLNSSHSQISYAVFCLKKKKTTKGARIL